MRPRRCPGNAATRSRLWLRVADGLSGFYRVWLSPAPLFFFDFEFYDDVDIRVQMQVHIVFTGLAERT